MDITEVKNFYFTENRHPHIGKKHSQVKTVETAFPPDNIGSH